MSATSTAPVEERLRELELALLNPVVRQNPERLSSLMADEFREFGSSGRIFTKNEIMEALRTEPRVQFSISDFCVKIPVDGVALATYRATRREEANDREFVSLRSSLWVIREGQWQILFHQGTKEKGSL